MQTGFLPLFPPSSCIFLEGSQSSKRRVSALLSSQAENVGLICCVRITAMDELTERAVKAARAREKVLTSSR